MKKTTFKKGEIIQQAGDLNTRVYHVKSGMLRSYSIDAKGKEHIYMFAPEDWIISDLVEMDEPAMLFIDALEDTEVEIFNKDADIEFDTTKLMRRMAVLQKRIIRLMSASAIERYDDFIVTYPDVTQRVPQRMIASYLGITPEALSKVKSGRLLQK